jgi:hypothetical protein
MIALAMSSIFLNATKQTVSAQSLNNQLGLISEFQKAISSKQASGSPVNCSNILSFDGPAQFANATGKTRVQLTLPLVPPIVLKQNTQVNVGNQFFTVRDIYLTDNMKVIDLSADEKTYISNLYIESVLAGSMLANRPRAMAAVSVTVKNGNFVSCNVSVNNTDQKSFCDDLLGFRWNTVTGKCDQEVMIGADAGEPGNEMACPPGTWKRSDGICVPTATNCGNGMIGRGFKKGLMNDCQIANSIAAKGMPAVNSLPAVAEGAPAPVVPVTAGVFGPPSTITTKSAPPAAPAPPAACQAPTSVYGDLVTACLQPGVYCGLPPILNPVATNTCVDQQGTAYSTPNLVTTPPSQLPAQDNTCQCNKYRIANNDYCMYCIRDVGVGPGFIDYTYGVSQCVSGKLIEVPGVNMVPSPQTCRNGYGRAARVGPDYRQYNDP